MSQALSISRRHPPRPFVGDYSSLSRGNYEMDSDQLQPFIMDAKALKVLKITCSMPSSVLGYHAAPIVQFLMTRSWDEERANLTNADRYARFDQSPVFTVH